METCDPRRKGRFNFDPSKETVLGSLGSHELVVDRKISHAHLLGDSLLDALLQIDAMGRDYIVEEVDCGHLVGYEQCVKTEPDDEIVTAYRKDRDGSTRFVLNKEAPPTSFVTVILVKDYVKEGVMILLSSWAGHKGQPEPWDKSLNEDPVAREASINFWQEHALVWDPTQVDFSKPFGRVQN